MKIVHEWPPNIEEINKFFDVHKNVLFTYGDTIYCPSGKEIPDHLMIHESIHEKQQEAVGGPDEWWNRFFFDKKFRLQQEVEAYHAQYEWYCEHYKNRNDQYKLLRHCAEALSGPVYGHSIGIAAALFAIKSGELQND